MLLKFISMNCRKNKRRRQKEIKNLFQKKETILFITLKNQIMVTDTVLSPDKELTITRVLNAPIELVWEVWTNPDHIKNWWGPNGFTNTIFEMDVKPGGNWEFIMH